MHVKLRRALLRGNKKGYSDIWKIDHSRPRNVVLSVVGAMANERINYVANLELNSHADAGGRTA